MQAARDLVIVGGGIVGCSAAAFAAERGASVLLLEASEIGAGASGRNSGVVQHPFDPVLAGLHAATLPTYRSLNDEIPDFAFPAEPAGLLLLTDDLAAARARAAELAGEHPELAAQAVGGAVLREIEPMLAPDLAAVRLATGYPIPPEAATAVIARRAGRAGAEIRTGAAVTAVERDGATAVGVRLASGTRIAAGAVLLAAGPWTPPLADPSGRWQPLRPTHGVTVQVASMTPARHVLEEGVVHTVNRPVDGDLGLELTSTFSLVSVGRTSTVGSTFLPTAPDPEVVGPMLVARGSRFVPSLAQATVVRSRVCIRPQSIDGRPFIGEMPGVKRLFVCVGHGPWGISTGPASAALAVRAILDGDEQQIAPELRVARAAGPST